MPGKDDHLPRDQGQFLVEYGKGIFDGVGI